MRIRLVMVGKVKEKYLQVGIQEYLKRLGPFAKVDLVNLPDEPIPDRPSPAEEGQVKLREAERILKVTDPNQYVIALDQRGREFSSEELAEFLEERALHGQSSLAFVVGGSLGLDQAVLNRADMKLSLGRMTLLHQMVPLILLEQVYRGFKINRGEPYHK